MLCHKTNITHLVECDDVIQTFGILNIKFVSEFLFFLFFVIINYISIMNAVKLIHRFGKSRKTKRNIKISSAIPNANQNPLFSFGMHKSN